MGNVRSKNTLFVYTLGVLALLGGISRYLAGNESGAANAYDTAYERGRNLAFNICGQCHYDAKSDRFSGKQLKEIPGVFGQVYASNLTHSARFGVLGKYSDMQLINLLKTGTAKDGRYIPWMLRPNLADTDLNALLTYFRSNDSVLLAVDKSPGISKPTAAGKTAIKLSNKALPFKRGVKAPAPEDSIAYGRYLVDNLACYHCHSKNIAGLNYLEPEQSKGYMRGGLKVRTPEGKKISVPGLLPGMERGVDKLTKTQFRKVLQKGIKPDGYILKQPMQRFTHLSDKQADAIYAYLKTLAPSGKKRKKPISESAVTHR